MNPKTPDEQILANTARVVDMTLKAMEKPKSKVTPEIAAAFELGFLCAEKGMNLQAALNHLYSL